MQATDILSLLLTYRSLIQSAIGDPGIKGSTVISSAYSFIALDVRSDDDELLCRVRFELNDTAATLIEAYCSDKALSDPLRSTLSKQKFPGFNEGNGGSLPWSDNIKASIEQADKIAALAMNCTTGDHYRPGNFSKISIDDECIVLEQVNNMNAKSLAHKNDYSLRSLEFEIPLSKKSTSSLAQYKIGDMLVEFNDRSSENNRMCGDKISDELERLAEQ